MKKASLIFLILFSSQVLSEPIKKFVFTQKAKCAHLHGCNLDECIKEISDKFEYKENLAALDKDQLANHLKRTLISVNDYQNLFDKFSEEEWIEKIYNKMNPNTLNAIPKTKEDQRKFIEAMKGHPIYNMLPSKETSTLVGIGLVVGFAIGMYAGPYAKKLYHKATGIPEITP